MSAIMAGSDKGWAEFAVLFHERRRAGRDGPADDHRLRQEWDLTGTWLVACEMTVAPRDADGLKG
jgi:hypothetical protein